jgi:chemotaxis protein methyltransferase CheR
MESSKLLSGFSSAAPLPSGGWETRLASRERKAVTDAGMSKEQFEAITALVYRSLGLRFVDSKLPFVDRRVRTRMRALRLDRVADYVFHLRFLDAGGQEMQALANLLTTNETYMFRDFAQLQAFADHCLPAALERREQSGMRRLRIWSAGCSSGEEAYTIAIIVREVMHDADDWDIQILATDIDQERLRMARRAVYRPYAVRYVPDEYATRHLTEERAGQFRVHPDTARLVRVRYLNLYDRKAIAGVGDMDFIFCRNVLIYFDDESSRSVVRGFYDCLNPGGFLCLGHSESVSLAHEPFSCRRLGSHLVYTKD